LQESRSAAAQSGKNHYLERLNHPSRSTPWKYFTGDKHVERPIDKPAGKGGFSAKAKCAFGSAGYPWYFLNDFS
jgi:hypothetical protein